MRTHLLLVCTLVVASFADRNSFAYPVQESLSLAELEKQADIICKVEAGHSKPADPSPYKNVPGFDVLSTNLKVIEVYKGDVSSKEIVFGHYAPAKKQVPYMYMPQHYELQAGKFYILFAKKTDRDGVIQQMWENHRSKEDQGLVRVADAAKPGKQPIEDLIWSELIKLLKSERPDDTLYAIKQLDQMSGNYDRLKDIDRVKTLTVIEPFIRNPNEEVAKSAISTLGSRNPYLSPSYAAGWLATVGQGSIAGYGRWENPTSAPRQFWKPLAAMADSERSPEVRALAIRALGRIGEPELAEHVKRWLGDSAAPVRAAAAVLLADFPALATDEAIERLANDKQPVVRATLPHAIGFGQWANRVSRLRELVDDADAGVAEAAAMSLLSLPLEDTRKTLIGLVEHKEYSPLFVNALATENPAPYLDMLCDIIRHNRQPKHWWGGSIPWGVSWDVLFKYAQSHPGLMQGGELDHVLDALESPEYFSSSEPRDLYALYVQQQMTKRAVRFREKCRERLTYDIDYYFKMVDGNPETYRRE